MDAADLGVLRCALASILLMSSQRTLEVATETLEITEPERKVLRFIFVHGYRGTWVSAMTRDLIIDISTLMVWNEWSARRGLSGLLKRKWVMVGTNDKGQPFLKLTKKFTTVCEEEFELGQIRTQLLSVRKGRGHVFTREEMEDIIEMARSEDSKNVGSALRKAALRYLDITATKTRKRAESLSDTAQIVERKRPQRRALKLVL